MYSVGMKMSDRDMLSQRRRGGTTTLTRLKALTPQGYRQVGDDCEEIYLDPNGNWITVTGKLAYSSATGGLVCVGEQITQSGGGAMGQRGTPKIVAYDPQTGLPALQLTVDEKGTIVETAPITPGPRPAADPSQLPATGGGSAEQPKGPGLLTPRGNGDTTQPVIFPGNGNGNGNGQQPGMFMGMSQQQIILLLLAFMGGRMTKG